jgi:hypothetical protein
MRLAKNESEGDHEELVTKIVVDVQDPTAPVFETARRGEGSHDTGRLITRLSEVIYYGAAAIDQNLLRVGVVKIDLGHFCSHYQHRFASVSYDLISRRKIFIQCWK